MSTDHNLASPRAGLGVHMLALWVMLVSFTWLVDVERGVYDSDDGAFLVQVQVLADSGGWWAVNPGADIDPDGHFFGVAHALTRDDEVLAFPVRPLMTWTTAEVWDQGGIRAAALLGITGLTMAAWSTAQLAAAVDRRARVIAFWLTGIASPLVFQSLVLQGHGIAAGLAGLALWAAVRAKSAEPPHSVLLLVGAGTLMMLAGMVRREVLLFGLALAVGAACTRVRDQGIRSMRDSGILAMGAAIGVAVDHLIVVHLLDFTGRSVPTAAVRFGLLQDRMLSVLRFVLPGHPSGSNLAMFLALGAAIFCAAATFRYGRTKDERGLIGYLGVAALLLLLRLIVAPYPFILGFVPAFPLALVMVLLAWHLLSSNRMVREYLIGLGALFALTALTQYPMGGGYEWGTRYFSLAVVILVPIGAPALVRLFHELTDRSLKRPLAVILLAAALIPTVMSLVAQRQARSSNASVIASGYVMAEELGATAVISTSPEIPRLNSEHLVRGIPWFQVWTNDFGTFFPRLTASGATQVPLFTRDLKEASEALQGSGWRIRDGTPHSVDSGSLMLAVLERSDQAD